MTRTEYLTQLELYLKKLPQADQIEAMDYSGNSLTMLESKERKNSSLA